jgi:hypothetical protein
MTDRFNALSALVIGHPLAEQALARSCLVCQRAVIDKWFSLQVAAPDRAGGMLPR